MPYYVWKRNGKIVAYDYSTAVRPAPAIEISDDEAKELGIYVPTAPAPDPPEPTPTEQEDTAAMLIDHEYRITLMELGLSEEGEV